MAKPKRAVCFMGYLLTLAFLNRAWASSFTVINSCENTVWPGIQAGAGTQELSTTGFELSPGQSVTLDAPTGWSGRLWGRTLCTFDGEGKGKCATGDCGGLLQCNGNNAEPPATLVELTLGQGVGVGVGPAPTQDFYDVSLVDGFNLPLIVATKGGTGSCSTTGCVTDLNQSCPKELQVDNDDGSDSVACKSACEAFGSPDYCCVGAFANPNTCKPSFYSQLFKAACPKSYSYAYDDGTSTFTCTAADYVITFCPTVTSQKKSNYSPTATPMVNNTGTGTGTVWGVSTAASTSQAVRLLDGPGVFISLCVGFITTLPFVFVLQ